MEIGPNFNKLFRSILKIILVIYIVIAQGCGTLVHHKVERGDSLYSIGFYYGQDYRDIAQWNDIPAPYALHPGQWLRVAPPEKEWWEGRKQHKNNKPIRSDKNNKKVARVGNKNNKYPVKSRAVQAEDFTDKASPVRQWAWPSKGELLNPRKKFSERNKGIDIRGKQGQPIRATADGKIVYSGNGLIGYGKLIIIKHNKNYLSAYAHNEAMLVKEGEIVKQGQHIAKMGLTPDKRVLLHFEIRKNGKPVDPLRLLALKSR